MNRIVTVMAMLLTITGIARAAEQPNIVLITIAELLKDVGYESACIGKWHLGRPDKYLPLLFNVEYDPSEEYNMADRSPIELFLIV